MDLAGFLTHALAECVSCFTVKVFTLAHQLLMLSASDLLDLPIDQGHKNAHRCLTRRSDWLHNAQTSRGETAEPAIEPTLQNSGRHIGVRLPC